LQCAYLFLVESACRHIRDSLQKTEIPDVHPKSKLEDNKRQLLLALKLHELMVLCMDKLSYQDARVRFSSLRISFA
jgi:hypothetical protein